MAFRRVRELHDQRQGWGCGQAARLARGREGGEADVHHAAWHS
jgi:hypothetical protein